jgi:hypothetical protein
MVGLLMNNKLETIWKYAVVACLRYYPALEWSDWGKLTEPSVRILGASDGIRTGHLPNTSLDVYRYINQCGKSSS